MSQSAPVVLILAAGLGTRMKSGLAKVLHKVAGRPLVVWPVELARELGAKKTVAVLGHQKEAVQALLDARYGAAAIAVAHQVTQKGTGDAVRQALPALAGEPDSARVLILSGDVPLLSRATLDALLLAQGTAPLALVGMRPPSPKGYGRLVRDAAGKLQRIVEEKDAKPGERAIGEVNAGIYSVALGFLREGIGGLTTNNAQGELYLTDLVARAALAGDVPTVEASWEDCEGINDRVQLARLDGLARTRVAERWMREGVTILAPETVFIDADVAAIGADTVLGPGVHLRGAKTRIGARVTVDAGCVITDSTVADDTLIKPYTILTESIVGARVQLGPFAHGRPGTRLDDDVHMGNFVETKKAHLGPGAKANHLSYLGDAEIGAKVNVGAGTITCNYDGKNKFVTTIEEGAFIGSDTQLVAPVTVGKGAYVAAGTTITENVPPGALALTRVPQVNVDGYVERKRAKEAAKAAGATAKPEGPAKKGATKK